MDHNHEQAYNLTMEQAQKSDDVVSGIIPLHHVPTSVLFDSEASHFFISSAIVTQHNIPYQNLNVKWKIRTRNGSTPSS